MSIYKTIEQKLKDGLAPVYIDVVNESHMHNVPDNAETHFKVVIASEAFSELKSVQRHQRVYKLLSEELKSGVHALAIHTYTPAEWAARGQSPNSPKCLGGE